MIQSDGRTGAAWVAVFKRRLSLHYIWVKRKDNTKDTKYEWKYIVLNDFYRFAIKIFTVFPSNPYCFPLNFLPFPLQFFTGSAFLNRFSYGPGHRGHTVKYAYGPSAHCRVLLRKLTSDLDSWDWVLTKSVLTCSDLTTGSWETAKKSCCGWMGGGGWWWCVYSAKAITAPAPRWAELERWSRACQLIL